MKYVGLPVKVVPEAEFASHLEGARRHTAARAQALAAEGRRRQADGESALGAAREAVNRARVAWLALPEGSPRKAVAERAYVNAMARKDEATRRAGDITLGTMNLAAAAGGAWFVEIDFQTLPGVVASTRTDSDGRFSVRVPRSGGLVIAIPVPTQGR